VGWSVPGSWHDYGTESTRHFVPGDVRQRAATFGQAPLYRAFYDVTTVEWVSTDMAGVTPRIVDPSDVAAFAASFGSGGAVRWGHENENPPSSPTFRADVTNLSDLSQHVLDSSDIGHFAADYSLAKECGLSKAVDRPDVDTIMSWYGFNRTGQLVDIGQGEMVPEYALTDPAQRMIGLANPEGYRTATRSGGKVSWGTAKTLYR
jgi:hypothetical protein